MEGDFEPPLLKQSVCKDLDCPSAKLLSLNYWYLIIWWWYSISTLLLRGILIAAMEDENFEMPAEELKCSDEEKAYVWESAIQVEFHCGHVKFNNFENLVLLTNWFCFINGVWCLYCLFRNMKKLWNIAPQFWGLNHGMPVHWNCVITSKGSCGKVLPAHLD